MTTFRYRMTRGSASNVQRLVLGSPTVLDISPHLFIDVDVDPEMETDLTEFMLGRGFDFVEGPYTTNVAEETAGTLSHSFLTSLDSDDHSQYLLRAEKVGSSLTVYASTSPTFTTSAITVPCDTALNSIDSVVFSADGLSAGEWRVLIPGTYAIKSDVTFAMSGLLSTGSFRGRIELNSVELTGTSFSSYFPSPASQTTLTSCSVIDLDAEDVVRIRVVRTAGTGTMSVIAEQSRLTIIKLK